MSERIFPTDRHGNPLGPAREEIVRCMDCKHKDKELDAWCVKMRHLVEPDGYCAWGERKEGGDD